MVKTINTEAMATTNPVATTCMAKESTAQFTRTITIRAITRSRITCMGKSTKSPSRSRTRRMETSVLEGTLAQGGGMCREAALQVLKLTKTSIESTSRWATTAAATRTKRCSTRRKYIRTKCQDATHSDAALAASSREKGGILHCKVDEGPLASQQTGKTIRSIMRSPWFLLCFSTNSNSFTISSSW